MESIDQESGRRRRRSYDDVLKRDAVRLVTEEKYTFLAAATVLRIAIGGHLRLVSPSALTKKGVRTIYPSSAVARAVESIDRDPTSPPID